MVKQMVYIGKTSKSKAESGIFSEGGVKGKVVALGVMVIYPVDKNCNSKTKN